VIVPAVVIPPQGFGPGKLHKTFDAADADELAGKAGELVRAEWQAGKRRASP